MPSNEQPARVHPVEAGRILARLQAHWPSLAAEDLAADDWLAAIRRTPHALEVAEALVTGLSRAPKIADWQEQARAVQRRYIEQRALPVPAGPLPSRERVSELVAEAKERVAQADSWPTPRWPSRTPETEESRREARSGVG